MFEEGLVMVFLAFALGGILKGAIGAGTPVIAVPIMTLYFGVPFAVAVFAPLALVSNLWQVVQFRKHVLEPRFNMLLIAGAAIGAGIGSVLLTVLSGDFLVSTVALTTFVYVVFRIARPGWHLSWDASRKLVLPVGFISGILQGAAGVSAPVSLTFVNAMRLERPAFIATVSVFFTAMAMIQVPTLWYVGVLTLERFWLSMAACIPLFVAMPLGARIGRAMGREAFDKIVMGLLVIIGLRLIVDVIW